MSDKSGKWLPYNQDDSVHDCKKKNGIGNGNTSGSKESIFSSNLRNLL